MLPVRRDTLNVSRAFLGAPFCVSSGTAAVVGGHAMLPVRRDTLNDSRAFLGAPLLIFLIF
jgi:hypothetical protein